MIKMIQKLQKIQNLHKWLKQQEMKIQKLY